MLSWFPSKSFSEQEVCETAVAKADKLTLQQAVLPTENRGRAPRCKTPTQPGAPEGEEESPPQTASRRPMVQNRPTCLFLHLEASLQGMMGQERTVSVSTFLVEHAEALRTQVAGPRATRQTRRSTVMMSILVSDP